MRYIALIDGKKSAYGVTFPDIDGCTAMGATIDEALSNAGAALRDIAELTERAGQELPEPRAIEELRRDPDVSAALADGASLAAVPLVRFTGRPTKANLSIDSGVLEAIDDEARRRKLTRSALVELLARHALADMP
ncbi:MAG TPA: type II toxin-antitoxin system HicB family antitoxin [Beijerinckiaceae bacterium]|jgi:predicted RNase H-like HicB family nuclease|nr:type II toxin-antitoxin system HicB family antitoxin [Beijerinckiaceae bacterium]